MADNRFICDELCPVCGAEVQVFGSESYPEEGIDIECMSDDCNYGIRIVVECPIVFSGVSEIAKYFHNDVCQRIRDNGEI